jgi:hypothetical protein
VDKQRAEAMLIDALAEVKVSYVVLFVVFFKYNFFDRQFAKEQAAAGEKGRAELENVNKQLVLIGELQLKYKERLDELSSLRRCDHELELLKESCNNEIKGKFQWMLAQVRDKNLFMVSFAPTLSRESYEAGCLHK